MTRQHPPRRPGPAAGQRGFGVIAALVVLVLLAALSGALMRIATSQQAVATQDMMSANAWLAARSGTEWGLYQAFKGGWVGCPGNSQTLDLTGETGMTVTVTCTSQPYNEGETTPGTPNVTRVMEIKAVACNSSAGCPDATKAVQPNYVERTRQVQVVQ